MNTITTMTDEELDFDPFAGAAVERVVPTSEAQREVWLADKLGADASLAFNESTNLRIQGRLDIASLRSALNSLVERHEALRATLGPDGTELLIGASAALETPLIDWRGYSEPEQRALLQGAAQEAVTTAFNLEQGPLFRSAIYQLSDNEHVLLMTAHHVVCDGWSWGVITHDLGALYGAALGLPSRLEAPLRYGDYVAWENSEESQQALREHERFWLQRFAGGSVPSLDLPTDRARAPVRSFKSDRLDYPLPADVVADVRKLGAKAGTSLFATLLSGFAVLLQRLTGQDDLVIGVPAAGQAASGMHELVGHCVNLLPVRIAADPKQGFDAFVTLSGASLLDAFEHQTLTYGSLLAKLPIARDPSRLPLVSVMFNVDQASGNGDLFPDLAVQVSTNPRQRENFELFINATPVGAGFSLECQYNTDLFDAGTIARWMQAYETLLRAAVRAPATALQALDWLAPGEYAAIAALQPTPSAVPQGALMHSAFVQQCAATPERVALRHAGVACTYQALDQRSNQLAHSLRARGIGRGQRVGICLNRGIDMVVALLAVLKAGGTYVPLDPGFPKDRLSYYAEDAQLALLLTESGIEPAPRAWRADAAERILNLDSDSEWLKSPTISLSTGAQDAQSADAAYIIYTSGSTGKPKGVCVPHGAVANFLISMQKAPGIAANDCLAAVTTLSFDIAVLELMLPLTVGAEVLLVPRETAMDGNLLSELLISSGATMMQATPGMWRILLDTAWQGPPNFKALVGGESLPPDLAREMLKRTGALWNMYGPTETTIWSTVWPIRSSADLLGGMSIGRPIDNTHVWILNDAQQPCPIGVPGEICIGGLGVAMGYLDRPELTADRFVADPFSSLAGARLYRTGDRGRWRSDGLLEHLGRLDFQVKVRGYRIELGEIEALCSEFPGVLQSLVITREDVPGDVRLVAYLKLAAGLKLDEAAIRNHLRQKLPDYMLPQHMVALDSFPLLPNGKVDRKALPAPEPTQLAPSSARVKPRNPLEQTVTTAMEKILNLPGLGIHDDFFAMGGHSLLAARLISQLNRDLAINLPMKVLFEASTAEKLAVAIERSRASNIPPRSPVVAAPQRNSAALTLMQDRIRFVEEMHQDSVAYNTPSGHLLTGPMQADLFVLAMHDLVQHQPALRTMIGRPTEHGSYRQIILDTLKFDMPVVDLTHLPQEQRKPEALLQMQAIIDEPMNIFEAPLFRVALYKLEDEVHAFLFMPHHIIFDGWSFDIFYQDIAAFYGARVQGVAARHPRLPVTYGDFADWQAQWMQGPEFQQQLAYWNERFSKAPEARALTPDFPRKLGSTGVGASEWLRVDKALTEQLREVARGLDATLNMLTMAIFTGMVSGLVQRESVFIGVPVRGRWTPDLESVMGFFNNMLPVPLQPHADLPMKQFVAVVKRELLDAFSYQDIPFERLAEEPAATRHLQRAGLYQALFSYQDARDRVRDWGGLQQQTILLFQKGATQDFGIWLMEVPNGLEGGLVYNADLYGQPTAAAFCQRYLELLHAFADNPGISVGDLFKAAPSESSRYLVRLGREPELTQPDSATQAGQAAPARRATLSPDETALAKVWCATLGIELDQVRAGDNFFDLGGSSLLAMRSIETARRELGLQIDAQRYIYESLAQLAIPALAQAAPQKASRLGRFFSQFSKK
jgi:amino acid adenylation domain-containing protein